MTKTTRTFGLSIIAAGVLGGSALGLAGAAGATTLGPEVRPPAIVASPGTLAPPASTQMPGVFWHHNIDRVATLQPGWTP
ncbi:hypothetical protein FZI85_13180 [Mycobacterium sp. CBMA293]|uniref:hypothetical protein n=1 Tax=unclassified Mycolicibacterium TaxID=2636767 RepID=UPI0012DF3D8D|nr:MULTISPECIES: hypothetical protein [unclassified Mycolicibacterium]MUL47502.1 hypothetical protein [Mycolicibacterium sp. CBMA 360]MUL59489.1 hypothetical protein [Mycolicibacterium sp. CBMA 335]MUL71214.1 hypothetical protein [Mycolicibacterium sp. CBMA 311]MUL94857.1 hypothetical protein [Mycolicibacterium sp. CBMA 230]MUM03697.1 hypothetical protein [Mycolicibacterium sp. CBMA 213]